MYSISSSIVLYIGYYLAPKFFFIFFCFFPFIVLFSNSKALSASLSGICPKLCAQAYGSSMEVPPPYLLLLLLPPRLLFMADNLMAEHHELAARLWPEPADLQGYVGRTRDKPTEHSTIGSHCTQERAHTLWVLHQGKDRLRELSQPAHLDIQPRSACLQHACA